MVNYSETLTKTFELAPDTPILDAEQVAMLREAGEGLLEDLIATFDEECEPRLDDVTQACGAQDAVALRESIHFIAGSAANIGLLRLAELCRNIEFQIKENRFGAYTETSDTVRTEYAHGLAELAEGA